MGNSLLHALGTGHIAEQCLEFSRIKYFDNLDEILKAPSGSFSSLGERLHITRTYTFLEEFCLAAFFQAYLGSEIEQSNIQELLDESENYKKYHEPISTEIIAYWVSGKGKTPSLERLPDEAKKPETRERIKRVRRLYFSDNAPLNIRHLDLTSRIYSASVEKRGASEEQLVDDIEETFTNRTLKGFLSRIILAPRAEGHEHLLPPEWWQNRCPYYIPNEDDHPTYRFLEPYIRGLEIFKEELASKNIDHSLYHSFDQDTAKRNSLFNGFLRLSLLNRGYPSDTAPFFSKFMSKVTGIWPPI